MKYDTRVWRFDLRCYITPSFMFNYNMALLHVGGVIFPIYCLPLAYGNSWYGHSAILKCVKYCVTFFDLSSYYSRVVNVPIHSWHVSVNPLVKSRTKTKLMISKLLNFIVQFRNTTTQQKISVHVIKSILNQSGKIHIYKLNIRGKYLFYLFIKHWL